ncbi:hypothetical protein ACE6H2_021876 [Prunus campanulata]
MGHQANNTLLDMESLISHCMREKIIDRDREHIDAMQPHHAPSGPASLPDEQVSSKNIRTFKAYFKYTNPSFEVVALIDYPGYYEACDPYPVQKDIYTSGNDHVVLEKGANAFVPLDISYCKRGMKLQVEAE